MRTLDPKIQSVNFWILRSIDTQAQVGSSGMWVWGNGGTSSAGMGCVGLAQRAEAEWFRSEKVSPHPKKRTLFTPRTLQATF